MYDPINGCIQQFSNSDAQNCTTDQWSDALGCLPTTTSVEQACNSASNPTLYWVGNACYLPTQLSQAQCSPSNPTGNLKTLQWYQGVCYDNAAQVACFSGSNGQPPGYWFSDGTNGGTCFQANKLTQAQCILYQGLTWNNTQSQCTVSTTVSPQLANVTSVMPSQITSIAGLATAGQGCLLNETLSNGKCFANLTQSPFSSFGSPNSLVTLTSGSSLAQPCDTPLPPLTVTADYMGGVENVACTTTSCELVSGLQYLQDSTLSCGSVTATATYTNTSYSNTFQTMVTQSQFWAQNYGYSCDGHLIRLRWPLPTVKTTTTCPGNSVTIFSHSNVPLYLSQAPPCRYLSKFPILASCGTSYELKDLRAEIWPGGPIFKAYPQYGAIVEYKCPNSTDYFFGFDPNGNMACGSSIYYGMSTCYQVGTRNSDASCSYTSPTAQQNLQRQFSANVQVSTPLAGAADSSNITQFLCSKGAISSVTITEDVSGLANSLAVRCAVDNGAVSASFGKTDASEMTALPRISLQPFTSLDIYANSNQIVGYTFNASESAGTIQSGSTIPFSHTTLTCPQAPASIPIGVAIKSTDTYITQLGLICGAWTVQ